MQLARAHKAWEALRNGLHGLRSGMDMLFLLFQLFPVFQHLLRAGYFKRAENVRMAVHKLFNYAGRNVAYGKVARFRFYLRMENYLQQHVAQLFAQRVHIVPLYGVNGLVSFFYHCVSQAHVRLLPVPGAAVFAAQALQYVNKAVHAVPVQLLKRRRGHYKHSRRKEAVPLPVQLI